MVVYEELSDKKIIQIKTDDFNEMCNEHPWVSLADYAL